MIFGATILMLLAMWGTASTLITGWIAVMGWIAAFTSAWAAMAILFVPFTLLHHLRGRYRGHPRHLLERHRGLLLMRRLSIAATLVALTACFDNSEPEVMDVAIDCTDGAFDVRILAKGDPNQVSNVTMDVEIDSVETELFPEKDLDYDISGGFSQWELEDYALSCDGDYTFVVTATNVMGLTGTEVAYWPEPDVGLSDIEPPHGTSAGGTQVTINGESLELVDRVTFDGVDSTILLTAETAVIVETPPGTVGAVDVVVHDRGTEATYEEGFTYYEDASGLNDGFVLASINIYNPDFLDFSSPYASTYDDFIQLEMVLSNPPQAWEVTYPANYPVVDWGDCSAGGDLDTDPWDTVGDVLTIDNPSLGERSMVHATDGVVYYYVTDGIDYTAWHGQGFDLIFEEEDTFIPTQELADAIVIGDVSLDWETKGSLAWGEDFSMTWDPATPHDGLEYYLHVTDSGNTTLVSHYCTVPASDGELSLTWEELTSGIDETSVGRLYLDASWHSGTDTAVFEHDNGNFHAMSLSSYWYVLDVE
ncbi:MAG TPA: IPT/TIG domain-containing protein [Myxococcota bacterium]|nr:IPT/TIG domain-containing protein [Myxococcota bacterium]